MILKVTIRTIGSFPPKHQLSVYKPFRSSFKAVYDFTEKLHFQLPKFFESALQMLDKNHYKSPLGVRINPEYKSSSVSLSAKQAITVASSSGFNVKLLHDWRSA